MQTIETERLVLRGFKYEDKDDLFEIFADEQTCLDDGGYHACKSQDEEFLLDMKSFCEQKRYSVLLKENQKVIGLINLQDDKRAVSSYELGFLIHPDHRRKGYMYEAVSALIEYCFKNNIVEMFSASCFPYNTASENLIKKLGFIYEGRSHKELYHELYGPIDLLCYYIDRKE